MTPRLIDLDADYPTLCDWWQAHAWNAPPQRFLTTLGWIIPDRCAAFLYHVPESKLAGVEWWVTNPLNSPMQSMRSLAALSQHISQEARSRGIEALFTSCSQPSLGRLFQAVGFQATDQHVSHFIQPL